MSKKNFKGGFDALLGEGSLQVQENAKVINSKKHNETRATFIINTLHLEQIKAISYWERKMLKTILYEALDHYISNYEHLKGKIKTPL